MNQYFYALLISICHWSVALAGITLDSTRLVYPGSARSVDVVLSNTTAGPSRYLAWIDDGDPAVLPEDASADFFVFPASGMLAPGRRQMVRAMYRGAALPKDRESVYYLNVLDLPQKAVSKEDQNTIAIANRSRIKIFMRPSELAGDPALAAKKLVWSVDAASGSAVFRATNASPYFVSMRSVKLMQGDTELIDLGVGMVAPWGKLEFQPQPGRNSQQTA